ncbi:origin recognition complex subunit 2 [Wolfiporia cocos MD-104 SS10]|uniref:Origin recognition complex subunit 2 n=1 Tax=Wolfiporia cocos (strain MD-104) TaxID=742152 RepID=A0A2H3J8Z8_WOLCO|nr:origin recognition complex subunit 2 [Wolfiporia cocos MD-104 SS10]
MRAISRSRSSSIDYLSSSDYTSTRTTDISEDDEDWARSTDAGSPSKPSGLSRYQDILDDDTHAPGSFATQTAFDSYFAHAARPARTSAHVFAHLVAPLAPDAYAGALARLPPRRALWEDAALLRPAFARWAWELREGFSLLFYGYGSKRRVLNAFARALAKARAAHVVVVNGFQPAFALKDLLAAVERVPAVQEAAEAADAATAGASGVEAQTQRIRDVFSGHANEDGEGGGGGAAPHLYLVIHNIDGPALRTAKAKACLALLALAPRIHLVASVDHIAAPTRWTLSELFARKSSPLDSARPAPARKDQDHSHAVPRRGFAWLWHDLTTLAPYDFELASADPSSLSGASAASMRRTQLAGTGTSAAPALVTESAARHVLASVTQKARKLFVLLGSKQLELMGEEAGATGAPASAEAAYDYERLFNAARDDFVATSDTALRALLAEFRDHGLVVSISTPPAAGASVGGEALWIPMRRDALGKVVGELKTEGV